MSRQFFTIFICAAVLCGAPAQLFADANSFDLSSLGKNGKTEYICHKEGEDYVVVLLSDSGRRRTLSTKRAIAKLKKRISALEDRIQEIGKEAKKKVEAIKARVKETKALVKESKGCQRGETPLKVTDTSGTIFLTIPLTVLPPTLDPSTIQILPDSWMVDSEDPPAVDASIQGFTPGTESERQIMSISIVPALELKEPGAKLTVTIPTPEAPAAGEFKFIHSTLRADVNRDLELDSINNGAQYQTEQATSQIVDLETTVRKLERAGIMVTYNNIVDGPADNYRHIKFSATAPQTVIVGDSFDLNFDVTRLVGVRGVLSSNETVSGPWSLKATLAANGPVTPTEIDPVYDQQITSGDIASFSQSFTCKSPGIVRFYLKSSGTAPEATAGVQNASPWETRFFSFAVLTVECVSPDGGETPGSGLEKLCKTTTALEVDCPVGTITYYAAAFIDPSKGTPTSFDLLNGDGQVVSADNPICPGASTMSEAISEDEVPQEIKDQLTLDPTKTTYWVKVTLTSTQAGSGSYSIRVFCDE